MPRYFFMCPGCAEEGQRILTPEQAKEAQWCECGDQLRRTPRPPTSQTMERLDNGFMTRAVERLKDAPKLAHEHAKGKKTAI